VNTRAKAITELEEFLKSDARCALVTGTNQREKHKLVLSVLSRVKEPSRILFRANGLDMVGGFFDKPELRVKSGEPLRFGSHRIFFDSLNKVTWRRSPRMFDFAVLYPLDSACRQRDKECVIEDLMTLRQINKVFLVSWTDVHDFGWLDQYVDKRIVFDAEEEEPEYHKRMLDLLRGERRL